MPRKIALTPIVATKEGGGSGSREDAPGKRRALNPDALAILRADSTPIEILEGSKVNADPKLIRVARMQEVNQL